MGREARDREDEIRRNGGNRVYKGEPKTQEKGKREQPVNGGLFEVFAEDGLVDGTSSKGDGYFPGGSRRVVWLFSD